MAKKIKMKLMVIVITIAIVFGAVATVYANDSKNTLEKVEELYANEKNAELRELEVLAMKDCLYPEQNKTVQIYSILKEKKVNEKTNYNLFVVGLDTGFPKKASLDGEQVVLGMAHNQKMVKTYQEQINEIYNFVQNVKAMTNGKSDEEKIEIIHNVVAGMLEYDYETRNTYKLSKVLETKKAICTGYSNMFYILSINCGIDCECVGNKNHMWNRVWLNNSWKHIDVTNNDLNNNFVCYMVDESALDAEHQLMDCFK